MIKIALITACGNKKESTPTIAGKLYKSSRIRHLYKRSKELNISFFILSAKYGIVGGDEIIEPYNALMSSRRCQEIEETILEKLNNIEIIIYYKGGARKEYFECIQNIARKLNKKFIYFGYGNMGDIGKLKRIINEVRK